MHIFFFSLANNNLIIVPLNQVIDEADRMMEQITNDWISQVEKSAYPGKSAPLGVASIARARPKPGPVTAARYNCKIGLVSTSVFIVDKSQNLMSRIVDKVFAQILAYL